MLRPSRPMMRPFISSLGQLDDRNRGLRDVVRGQTLHGETHEPLRLAIALFARLVLDPFHQMRGVHARFVFEPTGELVLGLLRRQPRDLLESSALLAEQAVDLDLLAADLLLAGGEAAISGQELLVALIELTQPLVEAVFLLGEAALQVLELAAARSGCGFEFRAGLEELFLGGELTLFELGFAVPPRLFAHARGFALGFGETFFASMANPRPAVDQDGGGKDDRGDRDP